MNTLTTSVTLFLIPLVFSSMVIADKICPTFKKISQKVNLMRALHYHNCFAFLYMFTDDIVLFIIRFNKVSYNNIFCFAACKHTASRNGKTPTPMGCGEVIGSLLLLSIRVVIAYDTTINESGNPSILEGGKASSPEINGIHKMCLWKQ